MTIFVFQAIRVHSKKDSERFENEIVELINIVGVR